MSKDRRSVEYDEGVENFINFALAHSTNHTSIKCPCLRCGNLLCQTPQVIREHLFFNGIDISYRVWYWHGEKGPSGGFSNVSQQRYDKCEYNDVADTIDMVNAAQVNCMNDPQVFGRLLEDAEKPLYPGCMKYTKLSALVKLYNLKARYGWSDKGFSELLQLLGDMLPLNNEMPLSMYEAKKTFSALVKGKIKKGVPAKVLWYFPPIPRFKRMFQSSETAKHLMWHAKDKECDGKLRHPSDSSAWKLVDHMWPDFASEPRNLRLALSTDGPRQPGKNIDVYLSPLVDDLKTLWEKGVETYDAHLREVFTLKAILLWTINDFPAYGNLAGCTVKGYYACPICGEGTYSKRLKHEYWKYLHVRHNLDVMHIEKNVCESIIGTLFNIPGKTKDGLNARLDLVEMGLRNLVSLEELKLFGLKSHDYHALMQQLLPVALRSVLPKHVRLCGPVYFRWMYPFERYMKVLKGYVRNHNRPEGCIAECYLAEEAVEFCTEYLSGTHAIGIPKSSNYDNKFGRPITGGRSTNIDHKSWLQAHHYVLENTTIVQPYIEEHMNWLKSQYPRQSKRQIWLQEEHMRCFTYWLKGKVEEAIHNGQDISNTLRWLAHGPTHQVVKYPGYIINGCRYHTKERDMTCVTQNSGVSILAGTMQIASSKDKNPCDWVDNKNGIKVDELGFTLVDFSKIGHKSDPFILASQAKQVFYVEDQLDPKWSIVLSIPPKDFNNMEGLDDFTDNCMEHHPFISSMPKLNHLTLWMNQMQYT
ncbi:hypothetical protein CK203_062575 [Vitis vinifera]|uniref:Transposase-associated domain-containing protein n=1 Tax=Vitis vinifera TaxID=29760 RepID=A0A438FQD3_VITVI|nr:hypothetical protein CK203_062575 [Vitis vinifera]